MTTYLNQVPAVAAARQPRGIVKVNGAVVAGWVEFEIENNAFYHADTFRSKFAESALPPDYSPAWWASQNRIEIEIFAGFPGDVSSFTSAELDSWIFGRVDDVTYDPVGKFIEVRGRDLTQDFIDNKTYEQFVNLTSSQIATLLAQRRGLTPVVTATTTKAGTYYELETRRIPLNRSEWDLLTWLAEEEDFVVYVKGRELHFEPKTPPDAAQYLLKWEPAAPDDGGPMVPRFNGVDLVMSRNLTLAEDIIVYVRSWNTKQKKGFTVKAQAKHAKSPIGKGAKEPDGEGQIYSYVVPGKTRDQAQLLANKKLAELSAHEMKITASLPADNLLTMRTLVTLVGTGTAFDQTYYPDTITRRMSMMDGYKMQLNAKNHSPESTVLA